MDKLGIQIMEDTMNNATTTMQATTVSGAMRTALVQETVGELRLTLESSELDLLRDEVQELFDGLEETDKRYDAIENALDGIRCAYDSIENAINELEEVDLTW